jgi:DNA replication licensing factor MCM2
MEQQSISISKAGIVTQLQARCSVIAAANPIGGRYDASRTFAENVELTEPILSRFDILFVVRDIVDPVSDARLARFVVDSHARAHPDNASSSAANAAAGGPATNADGDRPQQPPLMHTAPGAPEPLTQQQLRKYVAYAKRHCRPTLSEADADKIARVYARLRQESAAASGMPVAVRHLESIIRMAEAHAAMHLRDHVNDQDVDAALRVMLGSFVSTQKLASQKAMRAKFQKYLSTPRGDRELLLAALSGLAREHARFDALLGEQQEGTQAQQQRGGRGGGRGGGAASAAGVSIPLRAVEERAREYGINSLSELLAGPEAAAALADAGFRVDEAAGCVRVAEPAA